MMQSQRCKATKLLLLVSWDVMTISQHVLPLSKTIFKNNPLQAATAMNLKGHVHDSHSPCISFNRLVLRGNLQETHHFFIGKSMVSFRLNQSHAQLHRPHLGSSVPPAPPACRDFARRHRPSPAHRIGPPGDFKMGVDGLTMKIVIEWDFMSISWGYTAIYSLLGGVGVSLMAIILVISPISWDICLYTSPGICLYDFSLHRPLREFSILLCLYDCSIIFPQLSG